MASLLAVVGLGAATPIAAQVVACDFDIADDLGRGTFGSTVHLSGRPGSGSNTGTNSGEFFIINANSPEQDVDKDGYALNCSYTSLFLPPDVQLDLVNVENPELRIPARNIILQNLPRALPSGQMARVNIFVDIPAGTPAGRYVGRIEVRDRIRGFQTTATGEELNLDRLNVELEVTAQPEFTLLEPDAAEEMDSVVIRARSGSRGSAVVRLANTGNAPLSDVRLIATDLRSESAVGLVIPAENVTFSTAVLAGLPRSDTSRITVTVQVPRGILGGRYRGSLIVQAENTESQEIPLIVIVTSTRGILFANNPVRGGVAEIAFNGDPGTRYQVGIFDMSGLMVYVQPGTVFAGTGVGANPTAGADFAALVTWPLINGRGEGVASGMYLVVVESIVNGQRQLARDRLMVIR